MVHLARIHLKKKQSELIPLLHHSPRKTATTNYYSQQITTTTSTIKQKKPKKRLSYLIVIGKAYSGVGFHEISAVLGHAEGMGDQLLCHDLRRQSE